MKKIVALVLSLVMALSLATVAFGVDYVENGLYKVNRDTGKALYAEGVQGTVKSHAGKVNQNGSGVIDHYDSVEYAGWYYVACDLADADYALNTNGSYTIYVKAYNDDGENGAFYNTTAKVQDKTTEPASCTVDHYRVDGYVDDDGTFYVKDGNSTFQLLVNGKIVKATAVAYNDYSKVVYASHVFLKGTKNATTGWYECKCAICGATFACTNDMGVLKANSIHEGDTFGYSQLQAKQVCADNKNSGKYSLAVGTDLAGDYSWCWKIAAGADDGKKDDGKKPGVDSAKTFDAGIAMYVGMSLLSVAGSAVVIGKKKEF